MRAMVALAARRSDQPVPLREIAEKEEISEQYLEQIFVDLRRAGLVRSVRGARGGYLLARPPGDISLGELLRVLEGSISPMDCVDDPPSDRCDRMEGCLTRLVWMRLKDSITQALDGITLADVLAGDVAVSMPGLTKVQ